MRIADLGPPVIDPGDRAIELGTGKQAALLARLTMSRGRSVSTDALVAAAWVRMPWCHPRAWTRSCGGCAERAG